MLRQLRRAEIIIFAFVLLVFIYTGFKTLFTTTQNANATFPSGKALLSTQFGKYKTPRSPAALSEQSALNGYVPYELGCNATSAKTETLASRIRIVGTLCKKNLNDMNVKNSSADFEATVFVDKIAQKFSTDFIPLNMGENKIDLVFANDELKLPYKLLIVRKNVKSSFQN